MAEGRDGRRESFKKEWVIKLAEVESKPSLAKVPRIAIAANSRLFTSHLGAYLSLGFRRRSDLTLNFEGLDETEVSSSQSCQSIEPNVIAKDGHKAKGGIGRWQ